MATTVAVLLDLLAVSKVNDDSYAGLAADGELGALFGGQVAGQALAAAVDTVDSRFTPHSMHCYFLRPGRPDLPIRYEVDRVRDGRAFASRRVVANQADRHIFSMQASFQVPEPGPDHQNLMPAAPAPELCPSIPTGADPQNSEWPDLYREWACMDIRYVPVDDIHDGHTNTGLTSHSQIWFRTTSLVDQPQAQQSCLLACTSDLTLLSSALVPHGASQRHNGFRIASLDHCLWFHRPFRVDQWMLYDQISPSAALGRGYCRGEIFQAGKHVATVVQEGSIRPE
jgi:acyl-CoA thioesterase-2